MGEVTGRMLRRLRDGVKDYIHRTDVLVTFALLLMVLALVICVFGLALIWSGSQSQAKVNSQRAVMVQCVGIALGFVVLIYFVITSLILA